MAASDSVFRAPRVRRVALADFRSYPTLDLRLVHVVAWPAIMARARPICSNRSRCSRRWGSRRAELADLAREGGGGGFAVSLELTGQKGDPLVARCNGMRWTKSVTTVCRKNSASSPACSLASSIYILIVGPGPPWTGCSPPDRRRFPRPAGAGGWKASPPPASVMLKVGVLHRGG